MIEQALEPTPMYDDWVDWRDGMRHNPDKTHLRHESMPHFNKEQLKKENKKIKKQIKIKLAKKIKKLLYKN